MSEKSLSAIVGVFTFMGALWILLPLDRLLSGLVPKSIASGLFVLAVSLIAIPAYLFVTSRLLGILAGVKRSVRDMLGRGHLTIIAWQIWLLLGTVFLEYSHNQKAYPHTYEARWDMFGVIVPIVVAYGIYRIACHFLIDGRAGPASPAQPASDSNPQ